MDKLKTRMLEDFNNNYSNNDMCLVHILIYF
jgi:hypothetical protein